jgi:GTPase SAR1 family protein
MSGCEAVSSELDEDVGGGEASASMTGTIKYRVSMLGLNDTGKTALVKQFLTSEYMNTYDASLGKNNDIHRPARPRESEREIQISITFPVRKKP